MSDVYIPIKFSSGDFCFESLTKSTNGPCLTVDNLSTQTCRRMLINPALLEDDKRPICVGADEDGIDNMPVCRFKVGFWVTEKKAKKMKFNELRKCCWKYAIDLIQLDLDRDLESQGPLDAIVHKFTDVITSSELEHSLHSYEQCQQIFRYFERHSDGMLMLDPLASVRQLCNRFEQYTLLDVACKTDGVRTPEFVVVRSEVKEEVHKIFSCSDVKFPVVCKPLIAHGSESHKMALVFSENNLLDIQPPYVAQTFIPHNAVLFKVYIVGDQHFVFARPSLKNFQAGDYPTIFFDSHEVSKEGCTSCLSECDQTDLEAPQPNEKQIADAVFDIRSQTGLSLFGLDVIIDPTTGRHYIIDANTFPSYDGIPNFFELLARYLFDALSERQSDARFAAAKFAAKQSVDILGEALKLLPFSLPLAKNRQLATVGTAACDEIEAAVKLRAKRTLRGHYRKASSVCEGRLNPAFIGSSTSMSEISTSSLSSYDKFLPSSVEADISSTRPASVDSSPRSSKTCLSVGGYFRRSPSWRSPGRNQKEKHSKDESQSALPTKFVTNSSPGPSPKAKQVLDLGDKPKLTSAKTTTALIDAGFDSGFGSDTSTGRGPGAHGLTDSDSSSDSEKKLRALRQTQNTLNNNTNNKGIKRFYGIPKIVTSKPRSDTMP